MKTEQPAKKSNHIVWIDSCKGTLVEAAVWDFKNMSRQTFKTRFKEDIQKPLQNVLREYRRNPNVQMSHALILSIRGLIRYLTAFYSDALSDYDSQMALNIHEIFGNHKNGGNKVAQVTFWGISKIRKFCLPLCGKQDIQFPLSVVEVDLQDLRNLFSTDAGFASSMFTVERGSRNPGVVFPLLVIFKITEMNETQCPDTFMDADIVKIHAKEDLKRARVTCSVATGEQLSSAEKFNLALNEDPELRLYLENVCAVCWKSGVFKLQQCSGCKVARYCCKEHQTEHWKVHKKHCKNLCALRRAHFYRHHSGDN
jgi:hypothetical protein